MGKTCGGGSHPTEHVNSFSKVGSIRADFGRPSAMAKADIPQLSRTLPADVDDAGQFQLACWRAAENELFTPRIALHNIDS